MKVGPDGVPSWTAGPLVPIRAPLDVEGVADDGTATRIRREFAAWLAEDVADGELFEDLVLVVYEALANAADHAYAGRAEGPGPVRLLATRSRDTLRVTVTDAGTWRELPTGETFRGRGLALIRLLVADVHVEAAVGGTVLHLRTPLLPPVLPDP